MCWLLYEGPYIRIQWMLLFRLIFGFVLWSVCSFFNGWVPCFHAC